MTAAELPDLEPSLVYADDTVTLHHGDALDVLREIPDSSIDAVVTDPPYGLAEHKPATILTAMTAWASGDREHVPDGRGFMSKQWDAFVPPPAVWDEVLRVLKPGGHLLCFAGTRTVDLMGLSIRLAGFEIRDSITWLYGSGYPKSFDVSKAIDKHGGSSGEAAELKQAIRVAVRASGKTRAQINRECGFTMQFDISYEKDPIGWGVSLPTGAQFAVIVSVIGEIPGWPCERVEGIWRGRAGEIKSGNTAMSGDNYARTDKGIPVTDAAREWQGWGTALKPASEPIVMARKPLSSSVAANVLTHRTGALNIAATQVGGERWPANVAVDEHVADDLDDRARYFYCTKAPTRERPKVDGVGHPTVKPLALMQWLVRLVTPEGGVVLDPFVGSGTTLQAARKENFRSIGVENEAQYLPHITQRLGLDL